MPNVKPCAHFGDWTIVIVAVKISYYLQTPVYLLGLRIQPYSHASVLSRFVKSRMGDTDHGVRDTAAEVLGMLAANYRIAKQTPLPCSHIIFRVAFDGLSGKKEQLAAAQALQHMAPHVGDLDNAIVKNLLRLIMLNTFSAKPHILAAFGQWDPDRMWGGGFVTNGKEGILPSIGALIGTPTKGEVSGMCLSLGPGALFLKHTAAF
jgi:hypothetical protein